MYYFTNTILSASVNSCLISGMPNLYMVETVDSTKLATSMDSAWQRLQKPNKLRVFVQVNTSQEESMYSFNDIIN